jgi:hypothetical protein
MRILIRLIFVGLVFVGCAKKITSQTHEKFIIDGSSRDFIGVWTFVESLGENGKKIDTIWHGQAYELANGPLTAFYDDGTYSMKFTPKNTDTGKWIYHSDTKTMTLQLLIDPNTWPGSDVVKSKLAVKFNMTIRFHKH